MAVSSGELEAGGLAEVLGKLARTLQSEASPQATLESITRAAVETVPGATYAGVTMVVDRQVQSIAATDQVVRQLDDAQADTGEGPCLTALWDEPMVRMDDRQAEKRWPDFTRRAREHGIRSMLCFRLFTAGNTMGALNLYASDPDAFPDVATEIGQLFATHAAVALADAQKIDQLQHAVSSRDIIGQAKGILMERYKIDADSAFTLLVHSSQVTHIKLRDVADQLAATGEVPRLEQSS